MIRKSLQVGGSSSAVNSHLPSAESAGVSLSTLTCLRTGPELDLDGIAISYFDVRNLQFGFQNLVFFQIVVVLAQSNTASGAGIRSMISRDLIVCFGSDLDLEVCRTDRQTKLGGCLLYTSRSFTKCQSLSYQERWLHRRCRRRGCMKESLRLGVIICSYSQPLTCGAAKSCA